MVFWLVRELRFRTNWIIFVWNCSHLRDYRIVSFDSSSSRNFFIRTWWITDRGSYTQHMFKWRLVWDTMFDHQSRVIQISEIRGKKVLFCNPKVSPHVLCLVGMLFFWRAVLVECHYTPSLAPDSPCDVSTHLTGRCSKLLVKRSWCRILYGLWVAMKWESFVAWVTKKKQLLQGWVVTMTVKRSQYGISFLGQERWTESKWICSCIAD